LIGVGPIHDLEFMDDHSGHGVRNMSLRLLVLSVVLGFAAQSQAGIFKKTPKPDPSVHVPTLIEKLRTNKDEKARVESASELRDYDGKEFPEILTALTEALNTDTSSSVRAEAAESIGKIRPISSKAGHALEQAIAHDKSTMVRLSARMSLAQYRFLGYFSGVSKSDDAVAQSSEPPLAAAGTKGTASSLLLKPTPPPITEPLTPPLPNLPLKSASPPETKNSPGRKVMAILTGKSQSSEPPLAPRRFTPPTKAEPLATIPDVPTKPIAPSETKAPMPSLLTSQPTKESPTPRPTLVIPAPDKGDKTSEPKALPINDLPKPALVVPIPPVVKPSTTELEGPALGAPPVQPGK
jgi:hypothetical protein